MGLIKAAKDALGGLLADQWREYFYCTSLSSDVLMVKGEKQVTQGRNSNTKGNDNIISNGSIVPRRASSFMILPQSLPCCTASWAKTSRTALRPLERDLLLAAIPQRIREFTLSTPKR